MTYFPPYIDDTGLHIPLYSDIFQYLLDQYTLIFGQSVTSNISSSDIQSISIFAVMINDSFLAAQGAFNGMSPSKAIGAQQDSLYKLNGIARNPSTYSLCTVTVTGTPNFEMVNRVVMDSSNNLWNLPPDFIIPSSGTINVTATCQTVGAVNAAIGAITIMVNPVVGWTSVYNSVAASPGTAIEPDSAFRARQTISVVLPSHSLVTGTIAAIAAVPGVTRYGVTGVENPTGAVDIYGNPAHSISMVVEGGADIDVATAIYVNKTPGGYTNGTTSVTVIDPDTGQPNTIRFFRPAYTQIAVQMSVKALNGYTTATTDAIKSAVATYLNSLQIGEAVTISGIITTAMNLNPNLLIPIFYVPAVLVGVNGGPAGSSDVSIAITAVAQSSIAQISVTLV